MVDSAANRPAPTASGTLSKTPLVHLLLYVLERKLSGTLELLGPDKRSATVVFLDGQPAKVRTSDSVAYLGRVLHELGYLTEDQLTRSLADLAKRKTTGRCLHGELLMAEGIIDDTKLQRGLREQVTRKLVHLGSLPPESGYSYYDGYFGLSSWGGPPVEGLDTFRILPAIVRDNPPWEQVQAALNKIGGSLLRVKGAEVARLGLTDDQSSLVDLLRERALGVPEMIRAGALGEGGTQLLAYLLLVTKQVDLVAPVVRSSRPAPSRRLSRPPTPLGAMRPSGAPQAATGARPSVPTEAARSPAPSVPRTSVAPAERRASLPPVPSGLSPELTQRWKDIIERAATIDRADYFNMLELARDATPEEVESAYFAFAKVWHPDRLPNELASVREACSRVFARMSEARATLVDAKQRERYMKLLADGSGSPEMQETVARVVDASTQFQKAEVCFKRNDLAQAEEFCRRALELDESQPDYHALLAWLLSLKPENQGGEATMQSVRMLDRAVGMSDRCEKAYFYRGILYKRLGKADLAARDFRKASDLNPRNIDAVREVRLHTMRSGATPAPERGARPRDSSPPPPKAAEKPGLLGRLFKKT